MCQDRQRKVHNTTVLSVRDSHVARTDNDNFLSAHLSIETYISHNHGAHNIPLFVWD